MQERFPTAEIVPVSAEKNKNIDVLIDVIRNQLPESHFYYEIDQITNRSERFLVSEIIREKIMRQLGDELPYAITIHINDFDKQEKLFVIDATIFVEKEGQKKILIGRKGEKLKRIGSDARVEMEKLLGANVRLHTWVKVKSGWSDDERVLKSMGYDEY